MSSRLHVFSSPLNPCALCLKQRRSHPLRRPTGFTNTITAQAAVTLTKTSQALVATLLLFINLHTASPAGAKPEHTDYISVQDRTRQRAPLNSKLRNRDLPANEQTTTLSISQQVADVKKLSTEAVLAADRHEYQQALENYTLITHKYPDLAITQYARIQRALLLYELGQHSEAVLELEGEEEDLRGNSEVHAALAAMFYAESPRQVSRAETQWEIAREFDQRFSDLQWVSKQKRWPPAMQVALANFLELK